MAQPTAEELRADLEHTHRRELTSLLEQVRVGGHLISTETYASWQARIAELRTQFGETG